MASKGVITNVLASTILGLPYNQEAGFGGGTTVSVVTKQGNISDLIQALKENGQSIDISLDGVNTEGVDSAWFQLSKNGTVTDLNSSDKNVSLTLSDLLSNDDTYISFGNQKTGEYAHENLVTSAKNILSTVLDATYEQLASLLDLGDGYTTKALDYARTETEKLFLPSVDNLRNEEYRTFVGKGNTNNASSENNQNYMGFVYVKGESSMFKSSKPKAAVNINNMAKAFLTFFVKYMDGVASKDADGSDKYKVQIGHLSENKLATSDYLFQYSIKTGTEVSSDDLAQATFYDALFNQICKNGWSENEKITDSSYLQQMLQNGMLFISKMKDDGYYYQGNYATDPYIKEISDETAISQAESKYTTEKAKLNTKEETLDLKMKNLDTEISSLTTEYDTVKNTISKNIEKSFKRYSA
ncbi:unknown [Clostridium sp. CAG:729]|nr:unknown [Clostridium sp. CAG:729]